MPLFHALPTDMIPTSSMSDDYPMTADRHNKVVTEHATYTGDLATRRKNWVSGAVKNDSYFYTSKATTNGSGVVTFYITDDGTSGGSAVFTNVFPDTAAVQAYGSGSNYQAYSLTVAGDRKSVTATVAQITTILGLLTFQSTVGSGVECRLYVMGD